MTVIVVIAIGGLMAFFYLTIWPIIRNNNKKYTKCTDAICDPCLSGNCKTVTCSYYDDNGIQVGDTFTCVYKG